MHHRCSETRSSLVYMVGRFVVECWLLFCPMKHATKISWFSFSIRKKLGCIVWKKSLVTQKKQQRMFRSKKSSMDSPSRVKKQQSILDGAIRGEFGHAGGCLGQPKVCQEIFKITVDGSEIPRPTNSDVSKTRGFNGLDFNLPTSTGFLATFQSSIVW